MDTWAYAIANWYPDQGETFLANGYFGGMIPRDGHGANGQRHATVLAGFYAGVDEQVVRLPHWLHAPLEVDGVPVNVSPVNYSQRLDLRLGTMRTRYMERAGRVRVTSEAWCHRGRRNLGQYAIQIEALADVRVRLSPQLALAATDQGSAATARAISHLQECGWDIDAGGGASLAAQRLCVSGALGTGWRANGAVGRVIEATLKPGECLTVEVLVTQAHGAGAVDEAEAAMASALREDFAALRDEQVRAMAALWESFEVSGEDPFLERKLRACMFYLMSTWREDVIWGGSAAGLSQSAWGGSVFWDTEMYMFPSMLMFHPALAGNIVRYRGERLAAARSNALAHREAGARYPWESRASGRVVSPAFDAQRHIGPEIALAAWSYGHTTGDDRLMREHGWPMIVEIARHCASISRLNERTGRYAIRGVIPPDEHVLDHHVGAPIDNSVMTNFYCARALSMAADEAPARSVGEGERRLWRDIANRMYYPRDEKRGIYLEYDGYDGHAIKQADVGHLFFPWRITDDADEIRRNVNYYADRERETGLHLTHSASVYGIGLSRAGDVAGVLRHFLLAERCFTGPFEVPRESNYASGPVLTGAGGYLNLVLFGLMGIDITGPELTARPCLPEGVGAISVRGVRFKGERWGVAVRPGSAVARIEHLV